MEVEAPVYYILSRKLTEEQMERAHKAFQFTPISHCIITNPYDAQMALQFAPFIVKTTPENAEESAKTSREPPVIIGDAEFLDACYADGRREPVTC